MAIPSAAVVEAIENGTTSVIRRVDIYESDGSTLWLPGGVNSSRLVDGSVTVDYNRDERRAVDLTLDNTDNTLRSDPNGFWYDKVLKAYRGVRFPTSSLPPRIAIIESDTVSAGWEIRAILSQLGFTRTDVKLGITSLVELSEYDMAVSYMRTGKTAKTALLRQMFESGKKVISTGALNDTVSLPLMISAGAATTATSFSIEPTSGDNPLKGAWGAESPPPVAGYLPTAVPAETTVVATKVGDLTKKMASIRIDTSGGRWFHYQPDVFGTQAKILLSNALTWLHNRQPYVNWEVQVGEFCIDKIDEDNYPHLVKVTGRDYTKRCLTSKFERVSSFAAGTPLKTLTTALAANAGITKFNIPDFGINLSSRLDVDRTSERWKVMKQANESNNIELFFDAQGVLTARPFQDPILSPQVATFSTGEFGNLVKFSRSTNDSRLYNCIIVTGESSDNTVVPFYGEARNTEPSSPTREKRIGTRSYFYTSQFFTSNQQCQDYAQRLLKVTALESYEINWEALTYPWLDVGEIVEFLDPRRASYEPTRYLMDTINLPLGLAPMSATGKRVTIVKS